MACSDWGPDQEPSPPVSKDHATVARPGSGRRASPSAVGAAAGHLEPELGFLIPSMSIMCLIANPLANSHLKPITFSV